MRPSPDATASSRLHNYELNKVLFFINYSVRHSVIATENELRNYVTCLAYRTREKTSSTT
jgi:hypothetical protein